MPTSRADVAADLLNKFRRAERTREKVEGLYRRGELSRADVETVYEGLLLQSATHLENFLEDLFRRTVLGSLDFPPSRVVPRVAVGSNLVLTGLLLMGGKRYIDWLPYERTKELAGRFLRGGRPFSELTSTDEAALDRVARTRNAVAHKSPHALDVFERLVIGGAPLLPSERSPAGYLRSQFRISPPVTQLESMFGDMARVASQLCR